MIYGPKLPAISFERNFSVIISRSSMCRIQILVSKLLFCTSVIGDPKTVKLKNYVCHHYFLRFMTD